MHACMHVMHAYMHIMLLELLPGVQGGGPPLAEGLGSSAPQSEAAEAAILRMHA